MFIGVNSNSFKFGNINFEVRIMKRVLLFTLLISFIGYSQNFNTKDSVYIIDDSHGSFNLGFQNIKKTHFNSNFLKVVNQPYTQEQGIVLRRLYYSDYYFFNETQDIENKQESFFDENGNRVLWVLYDWDSESESFINEFKEEKNYDNNENITLKISYDWDSNSETFIPWRKSEYYRDEEDKLTRITYDWDLISESFTELQKSEFYYDNNNEILIISYNWDSNSETFIPSKKFEYSYDNNNETLRIEYYWDIGSETFIPLNKYEKSYDNEDKLTTRTRYNWDLNSESFSVYEKLENFYDENGNYSSQTISRYDIDNQQFIIVKKVLVSYDINGNQTYYEKQERSGFSFTEPLNPIYKSIRVFDEYNFSTSTERFIWDSETNSFVQQWKRIMTSFPEWKNVFKTSTIYGWNSGIGVYKPKYKFDYSLTLETDSKLEFDSHLYLYEPNFNVWSIYEGYQSEFQKKYSKVSSLSTNLLKPNSFSIYPNPTSNKLLINSSESLSNPIFELYDIKGSKILSNPFKLTEPIDVSDIQPSMYIYNVKDGSEVKQSGKVLIE